MTAPENTARAGRRGRFVARRRPRAQTTAFGVLFAASGSHMLNDMMQSLAPALYPVFRDQFSLSFFQTGIITFTFQLTASLLQPMIGPHSTGGRRLTRCLSAMGFTLIGLAALAFAGTIRLLLASVALIGVGSAVFHPEASRAARAASGGRYGLAQSLFQVGGNFGQSLGPLMAAFIVVPVRPALGARLHRARLRRDRAPDPHRPLARRASRRAQGRRAAAPRRRRCRAPVVVRTMFILVVLVFSKMFYLASLQSYYTFYLIQTFGVSVQTSQVLLFVFLGAVAAGTYAGGPIGDRYGRKFVIWLSILGVLPFTLLLPHLGLVGTVDRQRRDRPRAVVGVLGDRRLCAGADARQRRRDRGPVLRPVVRPRRHRRGAARLARRSHQPDLRLPVSAPSCRRSAC